MAHPDDDYNWPDIYSMAFRYPGGKFITFELTSHTNVCPYMGMGTGAMVYGEKGAVLFAPNDTATLYGPKSKVLKELTM